ncbi:pyruvate, water dikinase [Actinoplanes sp. ATCC 53533]|uniref:PEP/pyruvate-binding domain-containing protein n=1 Tax=Actinoplanes sp. ATCC 53533 TaxID=1288362 RepID=UPI000F79544F|nr:PEP/pyruvate-binding domain-containing protein [Actinoplanes sp. ATCC 53533]RSM74296.1 pyruvate, water dikinase [Actinoplanes sp. ATCC 53533]
MSVIALSEVHAGLHALVGGKAAGLGELIRHGERVPPGFCVTTEAHRLGVVPAAEIVAAYDKLGAGPVAVRSSATAEDLPDASFAGQHDTVLRVTGADDLLAAVATCWASLHSARAVAYREAHGISSDAVLMGVVVQRMVDAEVSGVLFTANPLTGSRAEMMVDAAPGLGTAVVDGATEVDHYVLGETPPVAAGCVPPELLARLRTVGERLQDRAGGPQDVEWAVDGSGTLWLLQSRPITTLFPAPPPAAGPGPGPRVYVEFGHVQGMLQPVTPMGLSTLKAQIAGMLAALGIRAEIVDIGGRLYGDLTEQARHPAARKRLIKAMAVDFGPRAQAAMAHVLADPRFAPRKGAAPGAAVPSLGTAVRAVTGIVRSLARPEAARARVGRAVDRMRLAAAPPVDPRTAADRMRFLRAPGTAAGADDITWPIVAGMLAAALPQQLLKGIATADEIHAVLAGMPHNVTIEMDLALWRLASGAGEHRDLLLGTPPNELAARYRAGALPEFGLAAFLDAYGHRGVAEVDLGVPRWAEDPAPVFAMIANYLRVTDPEQAPDRRFARAAATAEAALADLTARARRRRPVRGRLAGFLLRRARSLAGLRETGKFAGLYPLQEMRRQLLLLGADLTAAGRLDEPGDIMFVTLDEADTDADLRDIVAARRLVHRRESRRRTVPVALLSDGTDVEALLTAPPGADDALRGVGASPGRVTGPLHTGLAGAGGALRGVGASPGRVAGPLLTGLAGAGGALRGVGASPGRVTGPARVVRDPGTAYLEPGDILVAATTDPGWTPLFLTAAALVTETGAIMAHGPTVAREYGLPAVICVPGATDKITTGQLITVDGAAGTVTLEP